MPAINLLLFLFFFLITRDSSCDVAQVFVALLARCECRAQDFVIEISIGRLCLFAPAARARRSSSEASYDLEQWRVRSIALILLLSAGGRHGATTLEALRRAWIGLAGRRKCFVASIIPLRHRCRADILFSFLSRRQRKKLRETKLIAFVFRLRYELTPYLPGRG